MKNFVRYSFFAAALIFMLGNLSSCYKNKDTIAKITVLDVNGLPVGGAEVHVIGRDSQGNEPGRIDMTESTDASGIATFNFNDLFKNGQAGFAVLDIEVTKGSMTGTGIIKVEERTTNEATVTIQ